MVKYCLLSCIIHITFSKLQACVVIQEVVPGSDVAKDDRLRPGDQILEVIYE